MVMAAGFACRSVTRMREALAPPSDVARVQAAAKGEVNHRGDSCDDADQRSHGRCLCESLLSIHFPRKLKFEKGTLKRERGFHPSPQRTQGNTGRLESDNPPATAIGPDLVAGTIFRTFSRHRS